jgi:hypothetical protein
VSLTYLYDGTGKLVDPVNFRDPNGLLEEGPIVGGAEYCTANPSAKECNDPCIAMAQTLAMFDPSPGCGGMPVGDGGSGPGDPQGPAPCPTTTLGGYTYDCVHRGGADWNVLARELRRVAKLVQKDGDCFGLLSSHVGADSLNGIYLKNITNYYEVADSISSTVMSGVVLATYGVPVNGIPIVMSDAAVGASTHDLRAVILHEFAHLVGAIPRDGNDPTASASMANTSTIETECAKTLNAK